MRVRHLILALGLVGGLVYQGLNSFGAPVQMEVDAARTLAVATGPAYAHAHTPGQRDNIVVVLFDELSVQSLSEGDDGWRLRTLGPSYGDQRAVIAAAADAGAAAVFTDITYSRRVESPISAQLLAGTARAAEKSGTPVFFGPIAPQTPLGVAGPDLKTVDVAWHASRPDAYAFTGATGKPLAAVALYRALCADPESLRVSPKCDQAVVDQSKTPPPIILTWGRGRPPGFDRYWQESSLIGCRELKSIGDGLIESARGFLLGMYGEAVPSEVRDLRAKCPFHLAIPGHVVISATHDPASYETLKTALHGRVVIIASALRGSSDFADAPGIGLLPGAFQHAMALDNLQTFGATYKRSPPPIWRELDLGDVLELALALAGAGLMSLALTWGPETPLRERILRVAIAVLAPLALIAGVSWGVYVLFNWAAGDVLGVLATAFVAFTLARKEPWEALMAMQASRGLIIALCLVLPVALALAWFLLTWASA